MTKLVTDKVLKRETLAFDRKHPIVVSLFPFYLGIAPKGTREFYCLPYDALLDRARMIDAKEKLAARKKKRRRA